MKASGGGGRALLLRVVHAALLLQLVSSFAPPVALQSGRKATRAVRSKQATPGLRMADGGNFFGNMWEKAVLKIVEVKEKDSSRKALQKCVFCDNGNIKCDSCGGTGTDVALGSNEKCFLCDGKGVTVCGICLGTGLVDRVRRGGTDTKGQWIGKQQVMDPLSPQYEPYVLELDPATKYVWCQCGVSTRQPFCDGQSHRAYGIKPVPFTSDGEAGGQKVKAALCGCKYTNTPPYCDGSHVNMKKEQ